MTVDVFLPPEVLPTQLKVLLGRQRVVLKNADGNFLLRRRTFAPIDPLCTDRYTMPDMATGEATVVRIVLYKAVQAGWISLFANDMPGQGLMPSPAPLSHAMAHVAALARSRETAAREAAATAANARFTATATRPQQTWRSGCHVIRMKTPGGIKIHYRRNQPAVRAEVPDVGASAQGESVPSPLRGARVCEPWSPVRRFVPIAQADDDLRHLDMDSVPADVDQKAEGTEGMERVPTMSEAAAARAAIEAIRQGKTPEQPEPTSSDDEGWEGGDPDEIEYPLPGSFASCDSCGQCVDKYYHCVQCGVINGFDLCESCKRAGLWSDKHERRYPSHQLKLVTKHTAPIMGKDPKQMQAPPAPPPRPMPGSTVSQRVIVPLKSKVKYEWSQYTTEINLSVALPQGTRCDTSPPCPAALNAPLISALSLCWQSARSHRRGPAVPRLGLPQGIWGHSEGIPPQGCAPPRNCLDHRGGNAAYLASEVRWPVMEEALPC